MIWSDHVLIVCIHLLKMNNANMLNAKTVIMIFALSVLVKETLLCNMDFNIIGHNVNYTIILMTQKKKFLKIAKNARSLVENKSVRGPKIWWMDLFQKKNGLMNQNCY